VASSSLEEATGMLGLKVKPKILLNEIDVTKFDAVLFIGGVGAKEYFDNKTAQGIAKKAIENNKILGAICIAPSILANAGVLKDKKATAFRSEADNLKEKGASFTDEDITKDGNIITANGPGAAKEFAKSIAETLLKRKSKADPVTAY
jgi:protease I